MHSAKERRDHGRRVTAGEGICDEDAEPTEDYDADAANESSPFGQPHCHLRITLGGATVQHV